MEVEKVLKALALISLIVFLFIYLFTPQKPCDDCMFEVGEERMNTYEFMDEYSSVCFEPKSLNTPSAYKEHYTR